jgi:hypothetical protein
MDSSLGPDRPEKNSNVPVRPYGFSDARGFPPWFGNSEPSRRKVPIFAHRHPA